jgi:O-antigen biosynthesis protein
MNDLQRYFESNQGRLIHKWNHYFDIYDRHFSRFRNTDVHILEIGVYHGGSLQMWRDYFGANAKIVGVDIDPRCKALEENGTEILIGSQEDRSFLAEIRSKLPRIDILIDDGGHTMNQQIVTFEELFPHVREDGIYLCEDLHTSYWDSYQGGFRKSRNFIEYSKAFIDDLNAWHSRDPESFPVTDFTRSAYSVSYYGSVIVIEKKVVAPPIDYMTGNLSYPNEETQRAKEMYDAGKSDPLSFEAYVAPASLEGKYSQVNGRYFEMLRMHQEAQGHVQNLRCSLDQANQSLSQSQTRLSGLEIELSELQRSYDNLQGNLHQTQSELKESCQALIKIEVYKSLLEQSQVDSTSQIENLRAKLQRVRGRLANSQAALSHARDEISAMKTSKFWKIRQLWFRFKGLLGIQEQPFPEFQTAATKELPLLSPPPIEPLIEVPYNPTLAYEIWMSQNTPTPADLRNLGDMVKILAHKPLISVVVPVYNPSLQFLQDAIESVVQQVYPYWELCIADDASPNPAIHSLLEEYAQKDKRIKIVLRSENGHISRASNSALEVATGEFIALLDHDDTLAPEALYEIALMLNKHPEADMIYSDEDKIDEENKRKDPFFKPDWCPDSFLSRMYTCHLSVYRHSIIKAIGGFRVGYEGSQDYDLVLRFTEKTEQIFHIPKILYHWRIHSSSVTSSTDVKPYAYEAAKKAITEALERRGEPGTVVDVPKYLGHYSIRFKIKKPDRVSIIIPTKDLGHVLNQCLESIFEKSTYPDFEVILVDNGSVESYTSTVISRWLNREPERFRCYSHAIPFNYSKLNNFGVTKATGKYLLFLNNDTEVVTSDWMEALVEQAQRPSIGAVGAMLLYPDDTIQHAGVVLGIGGGAAHSHKNFDRTSPGYYGALLGITNYSAVTAACLMCRKDVFAQINGFEEELTVAYNDVDLCIRIVQAGFRNVWTPHAVLYHYESKSRGYEDTPEKIVRFGKETHYLKTHWQHILDNDPCYSIHLSVSHEDYRLKDPKDRTQLELATHLQQVQKRVKRVKSQLETTEQKLAIANERIVAMETSKFWKLRRRWFKLKQWFGFSKEEA